MRNKRKNLIMVHRKIQESGLNRHGQLVLINSTTLHKFDRVADEGWGLLANFEDAMKLTVRGNSLKVIVLPILKIEIIIVIHTRSLCSLW